VLTTLLLTEKALSEHDAERLAHLHDPQSVRIHVVVPAHDDRSELEEAGDDVARADFADALRDEDAGRSETDLATAAGRELAASVAALKAQGVAEVGGEVVAGHPVEPGPLEPREPVPRLGEVPGGRREEDRGVRVGEGVGQPPPPLAERAAHEVVPVEGKQVEADERRGRLLGEQVDAARRGVAWSSSRLRLRLPLRLPLRPSDRVSVRPCVPA